MAPEPLSTVPGKRTLGATVRDEGAAVVDFALVGALLTLLFVGVLQVALVVHVRNTLIDCAGEGARWAARADRTPDDGVRRTLDLIAAELSPAYAARVAGRIGAHEFDQGGVRVVEVTVRAPLPVVALAGPTGVLTVRGHAFAERQ